MITLTIDEKRLEQISHLEIRKKKNDKIVVVEIPKGKIKEEIELNKS